jgi:hypothetical protein
MRKNKSNNIKTSWTCDDSGKTQNGVLRPVYTYNYLATPSAIFSFWRMWTSEPVTNVHVREHTLGTFVINPLFHIRQRRFWKISPSWNQTLIWRFAQNYAKSADMKLNLPQSYCMRRTSGNCNSCPRMIGCNICSLSDSSDCSRSSMCLCRVR